MGTLALVLWALSISLLITSFVYLLIRPSRKWRSRRRPEGITILKPLKGVDPGLAENLITFFEQNYPNMEIIFVVASANDPAVVVVNSLLRRYPHVDAKLIVSRARGLNPKVRNLIEGYDIAKNDLVVVSDSNIYVHGNYLLEINEEFSDAKLGILTSLVSARDPNGFFGETESVHLNNYLARGMIVSEVFGKEFALGKSMAFRRSDADRFGGLDRFSDFIAEDLMMGKAMNWIGKSVRIAPHPVFQRVGSLKLKGFFERHLRWARIRKQHHPFALALEIVTNAFGSSAFLALGLLQFGLSWISSLGFLCGHFAIFFLSDMYLNRTLGNGISWWRFTRAWSAKEVLGLGVWTLSWLNNKIRWRGQTIQLNSDGTIYVENERDFFVGSGHKQPSN